MPDELKPDICVVGGGPAGLAVAEAAANSGASVIVVERAATGGASHSRGGVPMRALFSAAEAFDLLRRGPALGVSGAPLQVDFRKLRDHLDAVGAAASANVSTGRLGALGARVITGAGRFLDRRSLQVGDAVVRARRFVLATGVRMSSPPVPGLAEVEYLTLDAAFDLNRKPSHLLILGLDAHALELAQAYNRLGIDATVIGEGQPLPGADPELAAIVVERLRAEGIRIRAGLAIESIARRKGGIRVTLASGEESVIEGSHLLVATGTAPDVDDLGLDAAGVAFDASGIVVDRLLRTTNRRVYAIGDVVSGPASVARARYQADRILSAILYRWPLREHAETAPTLVGTDPALANVGLGAEDAARLFPGARILRFPFAGNDLAQAERLPAGMIKVIATPRGRILGAAIVGRDAGELIAPWSLAIANRLKIGALARLDLPYPTRAEISRRVAESFYGPGLTPRWRRRIIEFLRKFG